MPSIVVPPSRPLPDEHVPSPPPDLSRKLPKLIPRKPKTSTSRRSSLPPETPPLPQPPASTSFSHPTKRILSPQDQELFLASSTHKLVTSFVFSLSDSVRDTPISSVARQAPHHPTVTGLSAILDSISATLDRCPADENGGSRFGNPAFRTFLSKLSLDINAWHTTNLSITDAGALDELHTYLHSSFGSSDRIDYGSGHELNFAVYLLSLYQLSLLPRSTFPALALLVFPKYLYLMRRIQETYYLEPAGSHGVWGLDDYHFLPFLFGASQLYDHQFIQPLSIHSQATLDAYGDDYLYLDMVRHVNATKTVQGLRWHSPMLDDISGVKARDGGWRKVEGGMRKMFLGEVLGKLVVMQHFLFSGLVPAPKGMSEERDQGSGADGEREGDLTRPDGHEGHAHAADSWGDCCGIKVPSSVGAVAEMRKRTGADGLRRLPFD